MSDLGTAVTDLGGAVASLFSGQGNAAQATDFQGAATLAEQNAQLAAASTRIQETQTARTVSQTLGTQEADVAGAGFTESGSALDLLRSSAQQGSLAKSLVNIQGSINENSYAAQAGAYSGEAKAAKEASTAGTVGAIGAIGGALISGAGTLASAGNTVVKGYNYLFGASEGGAATIDTAQATGAIAPSIASFTDGSIAAGADLGATIDTAAIGTIDTSGIAFGTTAAAAEAGVTDVAAGVAGDVAAGVAGDVAAGIAGDAAAAAAADTAAAVAGDAAAAGGADILAGIGDAVALALC